MARRGDASFSWSLGPEQKRKEKILPIRALIVDGMFVLWCAIKFVLIEIEMESGVSC